MGSIRYRRPRFGRAASLPVDAVLLPKVGSGYRVRQAASRLVALGASARFVL
jgi:hypothetical protein